MKAVAVALALGFIASAAAAQTAPAAPAAPAPVPPSRCAAFPAEPELPDGATARNARAMQEGDATYQAWGQAMQTALECRRVEAEELLIAARQHEARVREYNEAVSRLNSVSAAWQAEAAEYNARLQQRR